MQHHTVTGGGGVQLHVVETGNLDGPPVLFIHGWSQSHVSWARQLNSSLRQTLRLIALDNRGQGDSEKPSSGYDDSRLWADEIQAVISSLSLNKPVLSGWSYGGFIMNDYVRHHGQEEIRALNYVGAATDLGVETPYMFLGNAWEGLLPAEGASPAGTVFSDAAEDAAMAMRHFVQRCVAKPLPLDEELLMLGLDLMTPPRVRFALFDRQLRNDDVLAQIRVPTLVTHGTADRVVDIDTGRHIASHIQGSRLSIYDGIGHAPFWEESDRFNAELAAFVSSL